MAISELLTTMVGIDPSLRVKMGPNSSAIAAKVLWGSLDFARTGKWPITGHAPAASGAVLSLLDDDDLDLHNTRNDRARITRIPTKLVKFKLPSRKYIWA